MSTPSWKDLKADGRVIVDAPSRKLAVYPNADGHVILLSVDSGVTSLAEVCPGEFLRLAEELCRSMAEARQAAARLDSEYAAHMLIERAKGT